MLNGNGLSLEPNLTRNMLTLAKGIELSCLSGCESRGRGDSLLRSVIVKLPYK